jgi:hypothetical protein
MDLTVIEPQLPGSDNVSLRTDVREYVWYASQAMWLTRAPVTLVFHRSAARLYRITFHAADATYAAHQEHFPC